MTLSVVLVLTTSHSIKLSQSSLQTLFVCKYTTQKESLMKEQGDEPKNIVIDIQKHTSKSMIKLKNNRKFFFL